MPTDFRPLQTHLKQHGFSLTMPRKAIFQAMQDQEPQTMSQLIASCRQLDRASVYRTVGLFERLGITQRLQLGWKYKLELTDAFTHHHHHLTCSHCQAVIPLPEDKPLENRLLALAKSHGFQAQDHQVEIRGLCANCQIA
jgi:Fur family ferric uptake transcriptional regulator